MSESTNTQTVTPEMILAALDVIPDPANPQAIAASIREQEEIGNPFPTLGAALATALNTHQIELVGHDAEGYPLYTPSPVSVAPDQDVFAAAREAAEKHRGELPAPAMTVIPPFDPSVLEDSTRYWLSTQETLINDLLKSTGRNVWRIGQALKEVKARVGHGQFESWLRARFDWSQRTAERYMAINAKIDNLALLEHADPSALHLLAAPSTPDEVLEAMKTKAEAGEPVKHKEVQAAIQEVKTQVQRDGDAIYAKLAGQPKVGHDEIAKAFPGIKAEQRIKAMEYLKAGGRVTPVVGWPGTYRFAPLPEVEMPGEAALKATLDELRATFDRSKIVLKGRTDDGAWHRALEIARRLVATGVWDGRVEIQINAYYVHSVLFGPDPVRLPDEFYKLIPAVWIPDQSAMTGEAHVNYLKRQLHTSVDSFRNESYSREDIQILLDAERAGANRVSMVKWLESHLDDALPAAVLDQLPRADSRKYNYLQETQRQMLVDVYHGQPVVKNAAVRLGLIKRGLITQASQHKAWQDIELSEDGQRLAALLAPEAPDQPNPGAQQAAAAPLDPRHPDVPPDDQIAWTARELTPTMREYLIATHDGRKLGSAASTCAGLVARELVHKPLPGEAFNNLKLTDKGRAVAEYLLNQADKSSATVPASEPKAYEDFVSPADQESADTVAPSAAEPPQGSRDDSPARRLPAGMTFERLHTPAQSDDHDPDLAAAVLLRKDLDKLALALLDAIDAFERVRSIRSLGEFLPKESAEKTNQLLRVAHERLRGAMNHASELNRQLTEAINNRPSESNTEETA